MRQNKAGYKTQLSYLHCNSHTRPICYMFAKPAFIYFDIDDTLLDHMHAQEQALYIIYQQRPALQKVPFKAFNTLYKSINSGLWRDYSLGYISKSELKHRRFTDTFLELNIMSEDPVETGTAYINAYRTEWKWVEGAREVYEEICRHYPTGLITNGFAETQKKKIIDFGLDQLSGPVIISEEVGHLKPSPEIFSFAEKQAGVSGAEILYVGDNFMSDIVGGSEAGWQTAWFTQTIEASKAERAQLVFSSFLTLKQALIENSSGTSSP